MNSPKTKSKIKIEPLFLIGTSGWTYDHWKGLFYPESLPKKSWFDYYAGQFPCVEVNATFYRFFKDQTYENWRKRAPGNFRYVLKAPRLITHRKYLKDVEADISSFYHSCTLLQEKFGMILLQVAPNMAADRIRLEQALKAFPDPGKVAVEFRRPEWLSADIMSLLHDFGSTICNADSPQQKITSLLTSNQAYLRLHGRNHWYTHNYSADELREIASLAQDLASRGANTVYIFFNNDFAGYAPANAQALQKMLN